MDSGEGWLGALRCFRIGGHRHGEDSVAKGPIFRDWTFLVSPVSSRIKKGPKSNLGRLDLSCTLLLALAGLTGFSPVGRDQRSRNRHCRGGAKGQERLVCRAAAGVTAIVSRTGAPALSRHLRGFEKSGLEHAQRTRYDLNPSTLEAHALLTHVRPTLPVGVRLNVFPIGEEPAPLAVERARHHLFAFERIPVQYHDRPPRPGTTKAPARS